MPSDDKYPDGSGRRRFVKGVVGSSTLAALGTAGAVSLKSTTSPTGEGGGTVQYYGIENVDGPAPRGMPQIPVEIADDGTLEGRWPDIKEVQNSAGEIVTKAEMELGGITYSSEWFQYCGAQTYEGLEPDADVDSVFRSVENPPKEYAWQREQLSGGEPLKAEHFSDYEAWGNAVGKSGLGKPAMAKWRTPEGGQEIPVQVLRSSRIERSARSDEWLEASTQRGFMAWFNKCTHFCCVPSFKGTTQSTKFGAADEVYCACHQSVYDPFSIKKLQFVALPRPEDG